MSVSRVVLWNISDDAEALPVSVRVLLCLVMPAALSGCSYKTDSGWGIPISIQEVGAARIVKFARPSRVKSISIYEIAHPSDEVCMLVSMDSFVVMQQWVVGAPLQGMEVRIGCRPLKTGRYLVVVEASGMSGTAHLNIP